jgi:LysR family transcriptional regulator, low CO2-responsive transcriptional regulator
MNLTQLRVFEALAEFRSFSKAAEALNLSQPSVTIQIKSLQDEYGVTLFRRHGQSIRLSLYGLRLLPKIKRLVGVLDDMEWSLKNPEQLNHGHLSVGFSGPHSGIKILSAFTRQNPHVRISANMTNSKNLLEQLAKCQIDIAIVNIVGSVPKYSSTFYQFQELKVLVFADHPWAKRDGIDIRELDGQSVILREKGAASREHFEKMVAATGIVPHITLDFNSHEGMKHAVAERLGVGVAHEMQIDQQGWLVTLPILGGDIRTAQYLVCLPEYKQSSLVQSFIEAASSIQQDQKVDSLDLTSKHSRMCE